MSVFLSESVENRQEREQDHTSLIFSPLKLKTIYLPVSDNLKACWRHTVDFPVKLSVLVANLN